MNKSEDLPAILGGTAIRPEGPPTWPPVDPELHREIQGCLVNGSWAKYDGPACNELRQLIRDLHGGVDCWLTCSGTAAVELALRGVGVGSGDEVILAAYDFKGNFQDVLAVGAVPVLVDVRHDNWALDVSNLESALSPRVKAIIASHLHGAQVDMRSIRIFADAHRIALIEDACQAPLARVQGRVAGTWGDVGVFSFGGSKLLTAGRGGAVVSSRSDVIQRIRVATWRGNDAYPLSELQAAVLIPQWKVLAKWNQTRAHAVEYLRNGIRQVGLASFAASGRPAAESRGAPFPLRPFPAPEGDSVPAFYKWGFEFLEEQFAPLSIDQFASAMRAEGVAIDRGFRALHLTHSSRRFRVASRSSSHANERSNLSEAKRADEHVLTLHHPILAGSTSDLRQFLEAVLKVHCHREKIASNTVRSRVDSLGE